MSLGRQRTQSNEDHNPHEFSFRHHPRTTVKKKNIRFVTPTKYESCTPRTGTDEDGNLTNQNDVFSNGSYDLQQTCHQLSTVVVRRALCTRLGNQVDALRNECLFQENLDSSTDIPEKETADGSDPLGFNIMSEVMAIGKESEK
jgi:hypothetical protein